MRALALLLGLAAGLNGQILSPILTGLNVSGGGSPITLLVHNATAGSANTVTSGVLDTTGSNFIVVVVMGVFQAATPSMSDNKGNTYTAVSLAGCPTGAGASGAQVQMYYVYAPTVGTGHTVTFSQTGAFGSINVLAFSGTVGSTIDQQSCAANIGVGNTSQQGGSVTPGHNNEVLISGLSAFPVTAISVSSPFTISDINGTSGASAYQIQTTATAQNPTWNWTSVTQGYVLNATFQ